MRSRMVFAVASVALIALLTPSLRGQGKSRGGFGGFPGGGFPGGGGGFPGGGFPGGGFGNRDPNQMFDFLARGRGYFLVTDTNRLREPLTQFLQTKGITSGQVTRELFAAYNEQVKSGLASGPGGFSGPGMSDRGGPGGPSFGMNPQGGNPLDTLNQLAETEFKIRDRNGDGFLNQDEMPDQLKAELSKWDGNRDNLISLDEFKIYYVARMQSRRGGRDQGPNPVTIILEEEDLETRPVVYRAGKLPTKELPSWFMELDTNKDGQVALYEWYKGGKDVDEFRDWDRDNDGFITAEEALRKQRTVQLASASARSEEGESPSAAPTMQKGPRNFSGPGGDDRGKSKGKKGNFKFEFKRPQ